MTSEVQRPPTRLIIAEQTMLNLLRGFHDDWKVPDVVDFAVILDESEQHGMEDAKWYDTGLALVLSFVGRSAMGEDPDMLMLEFRANSIDRTGERS